MGEYADLVNRDSRYDDLYMDDTNIMTTPSATPSSLHAKLAEVQGLIVMVAKDGGRNTNQNYDFVNEGSFLRRLKPLLSERGLSLVVSFDLMEYRVVEGTDRNGGIKLTFIAIGVSTATLTDAETGESLSVNASGVAHDTGDKAVYKAQTGGAKYAYWKMFALATGDDPENNSTSDEGVRVAPRDFTPASGKGASPTDLFGATAKVF